MKKILHMGMCMLTMLLLAGCAKFEPQDDAVSVDKNGKITRAFVDEFVDGSNRPYSTEEIGAMMQEELDTYNKKFGVEHILMKKCEIENGKLVLQIECDEAKYYQDYCSYFNDDFSTEEADVEFFAGALVDASEYDFEAEFVTAQGAAVDKAEVLGQGHYGVVILNEPIEVYVPGKIQYVSSNVEILGDKQARVMAGEEEQPLQRAYIIYK